MVPRPSPTAMQGGRAFWKGCPMLKDTRLEKLLLPTPCCPGVLGRETQSVSQTRKEARDTQGSGPGLGGGSIIRASPDTT